METVVLDGVSYVKASVAAEQFRYTQDYIGQLCRGKKIDARLVGRTWFVNIDSIKAHRRGRYQKEAPLVSNSNAEIMSETDLKTSVSRKTEVKPFVKTVTLKQVQEVKTKQKERRLRVAYEFDDESLVPTIHKKEEIAPRSVRIEHVDAKKISISDAGKNVVSFQAGELPTVSLSGVLEVEGFPEVEELEEGDKSSKAEVNNNNKNKAISDDVGIKLDDLAPVLKDSKPSTVTLKREAVTSVQSGVLADKGKVEQKNIPREQASQDIRSSKVEQDQIVHQVALSSPSFTPQSVKQLSVERVPTIVLVSPLIATLFAFGCVAFIMMASVSVTVRDSGYESHLTLQLANLLELLDR
jgi:hypothetical protein